MEVSHDVAYRGGVPVRQTSGAGGMMSARFGIEAVTDVWCQAGRYMATFASWNQDPQVSSYAEMVGTLCLAQVPEADRLLATDPFALLTGMLLDQQFPMERAFAGPHILAERLGDPMRLDPAVIMGMDEEVLKSAAAGPPAIHRYPSSMVARIQQVATVVCNEYDGDAANLWLSAKSGLSVRKNLKQLPGFGDQKATIFIALLGKQIGYRPTGWRAASAPYGGVKTYMSVADVVDAQSLAKVRAYKKQKKVASRA